MLLYSLCLLSIHWSYVLLCYLNIQLRHVLLYSLCLLSIHWCCVLQHSAFVSHVCSARSYYIERARQGKQASEPASVCVCMAKSNCYRPTTFIHKNAWKRRTTMSCQEKHNFCGGKWSRPSSLPPTSCLSTEGEKSIKIMYNYGYAIWNNCLLCFLCEHFICRKHDRKKQQSEYIGEWVLLWRRIGYPTPLWQRFVSQLGGVLVAKTNSSLHVRLGISITWLHAKDDRASLKVKLHSHTA